jgi:predicted nucleotide-binding protein (sugar kinase/HSP70/actin superfamily)
MKIAVPRMGNLALAIRDLVQRFDLDYIETPPFSEQTMETGTALAPEFACLPLKAVLGSFVQVLEMGADVLVTGGGHGPCRFGYYGEIQRRILEREGMKFKMVVLEPPSVSYKAFHDSIRDLIPRRHVSLTALAKGILLVLKKVVIFDSLEKRALALRGLEAEPGAVDAAFTEAQAIVSQAFSKKEIEEAEREAQEFLSRVPLERGRPYLKVGLVGEIFVVLEPFFNFDIDRWLGKRGVVVERSVHMADTVYPGGRNPVFGYPEHDVAKAAAPFLSHEVGGDGLLTVGASVIFARRGFDAVVHFLPFTCMPEVIAKGVLGRVSSELGIPVLSLSIDEQTGRAGVETRLEALLDLAWSNKKKGEKVVLELEPVP